MGWNNGFSIFEATVIGAYDAGRLDAELLGIIMEPYRGTDVDEGGYQGMTTKDGKDVFQVGIEACGLPYPAPMKRPAAGASDKTWAQWDARSQQISDAWDQVCKRCGWE